MAFYYVFVVRCKFLSSNGCLIHSSVFLKINKTTFALQSSVFSKSCVFFSLVMPWIVSCRIFDQVRTQSASLLTARSVRLARNVATPACYPCHAPLASTAMVVVRKSLCACLHQCMCVRAGVQVCVCGGVRACVLACVCDALLPVSCSHFIAVYAITVTYSTTVYCQGS